MSMPFVKRYVAWVLPEALLTLSPAASPHTTPLPGLRPVSQRSLRPLETMTHLLRHDRLPAAAFRVSPALNQFPRQLWQRLLVRSWREGGEALLSYGEDYAPLRQAIAAYLGPARGVWCTADQVILVAGAQQGLDLAARVLLAPGQTAWIEDPGYPGARGALLTAGIQPVPVPVDAEGLDIVAGVAHHAGATLAYVTPSRQFPLGMTMSLRRRLELLAWATQARAWIIEDDYDSEYRYTGRPLASLQGLDRDTRVIYVGTFSKVLFPALRLAYLVVPAALVEAFTTMRTLVSRHPPLLEQHVLAAFLAEGHFARHLRRMRALYARRQQALVDAARRELGGLLHVPPADAGMHLVGWLPEGMDDDAVSRRAAAQGIAATPLSAYALAARVPPGLVLGYTGLNEQTINQSIRLLAGALHA
jgi:GntR family transcriptional regulator / MocR family aminotransferase